MATALGCLPSAIDEEPAIRIFELLDYWREEPPTHVILAMRYLGERRKKKPVTEEEAAHQVQELQTMIGAPPAPMPPHLREMAAWAEAQAQQLKGTKRG